MTVSVGNSAEGTLLEAMTVGSADLSTDLIGLDGRTSSTPPATRGLQPDVDLLGLDWSPELDVLDGHRLERTWTVFQASAATESIARVDELTSVSLATSTVHDEIISRAWQQAVQEIWGAVEQQSAQITALLGAGALPLIQTLGSSPLKIEQVPIATLMAKGAYAQATETIYLAEEWVGQQSIEGIVAVLIEEIGHWLDSQVNAIDTAGDEGAMFAALVQEQALTDWASLRAEEDSATFTWQGQTLAVEQAGLGEFSVDASGQVVINFIFDNGSYAGELAVFELTGMDAYSAGSAEYIQEAARRALSNSNAGAIVISDVTEGAARSGTLGEADRGRGTAVGARNLGFTAGTQFALMLVPNGTVQQVFDNPNAGNSLRPLFSLAAANPGGANHLAEVASNVFAWEDLRADQDSDQDFNDIVFTIQGVTGEAVDIKSAIAPGANWLDTPDGQLLSTILSSSTLPPNLIGSAITSRFVREGVLLDPTSGLAESSISSAVPIIEADGKRIYIGLENPTGINKNPVIRAYNISDGSEAWVQGGSAYESGGPDGTGIGLAWSGTKLYAVFTIDGGDTGSNLSTEAQDADTAWLRSYGAADDPAKVSIIGEINTATGALEQSAFLTAIKSNGKTNSLLVTNITVNSSGNLVVTADSFFTPRQVNGQAFQNKTTTADSPFTYTVELTPDLKRVLSTFAEGWS